MKPSVGRIVHYVSYGTPGGEYGKECRAAVVTEVNGDFAGLCVLNPTGQFFNRSIPHDEGTADGSVTGLCGGKAYDGGTWHWPEDGDMPDLDLRAPDLSPDQVKQMVAKVQAALLQQAKRSRRPGSF